MITDFIEGEQCDILTNARWCDIIYLVNKVGLLSDSVRKGRFYEV